VRRVLRRSILPTTKAKLAKHRPIRAARTSNIEAASSTTGRPIMEVKVTTDDRRHRQMGARPLLLTPPNRLNGFSTFPIRMSKQLCKVNFQGRASREPLLTRHRWANTTWRNGGRSSGRHAPRGRGTFGIVFDPPARKHSTPQRLLSLPLTSRCLKIHSPYVLTIRASIIESQSA